MKRRLLLSYLSLTLFVLLLLELPLAVFFQQRETDRLSADLERDATVLATIVEDALENSVEVDPTPAFDYRARTNARVVIVDDQGISLLDTANDARRDFSTRPEFALALTGERATGTRRSDTLDTDLLFVAVPVASGGRVHGALRLTLDTHEVNQRVHAFWWGLAAVGGVVLVVVAAFGWALSNSITRPINRLQGTAARFSGGDLTRTTPDRAAPAELINLEESLNVMATRLDRLIDQQRAFVADASHQLRTPLTALRLRLENIQSAVSDPDQSGELEAAISETDRLAELVSDMLKLANAEKVPELAACDLLRIAKNRCEMWRPVADQANVELRLDPDGVGDELWALAGPGAVEQILDNLVSNAVEASPADSMISIGLRSGRHKHDLSVVDQGPGLSAEERVLATERFWRANPTTSGTGLGLAIVRSLAEASGGSLTLRSGDDGGLEAVVSFVAVDATRRSGDKRLR